MKTDKCNCDSCREAEERSKRDWAEDIIRRVEQVLLHDLENFPKTDYTVH